MARAQIQNHSPFSKYTTPSSTTTISSNSPQSSQECHATPSRRSTLSLDLDLDSSFPCPKKNFKPEFVEEWLWLLSVNGFLNGTYTEAVFKTNFIERSVVILSSWIGEGSSSDARDRGFIVGQALFEASFVMKINISDLILHMEEIANTFMLLLENSEPELIEEGKLSKVKVMELSLALMLGIIADMKEELAEVK